jgi:DNA-binding beta-propeller fold protein YncE
MDFSFGSNGAGEGQFRGPNGIATDSKGNVWVADTENSRIEEFNSEGKYLRKSTGGTSNDQLSSPDDLAIDSKGDLWVVNTGHGRIEHLNSEGGFIGSFGEVGSGNGQLNTPSSIAIDSKGNFWVTDHGNERVEQFNSEGKYVSQFKYAVYSPTITIDSSNNIWLTDGPHGRIAKYNTSGTFLGQIGEGQLSEELGDIVIDAGGNFWVADADNNVVKEFSAKGEYLNHLGDPKNFYQYFGLASAGGSSFWAGNFSLSRVEKWTEITHEWNVQTTEEPAGAMSSWLNSVSCTASETCAAVGSYETSTGVLQTLGKVETSGKWSLTSTPNPSEASSSWLADVSCTASNACTAVGNATVKGKKTPLVERWNGSSWSTQSVPIPAGAKWSNLSGVTCKASNDCIAVGYSETESETHTTLAERWNGTSWSVMSTPNVGGIAASELYSVSCASASDCWATGRSSNLTGGMVAALAEHWNGTGWSINSPSSLASSLSDVSCASSSSCVATTSKLTMVRWNGSTWSQETAATPEGAIKNTTALSVVSCTSSSACIATGYYWDMLTVKRQVAEGWNGSKWSVQSTSAPLSVEEAENEEEGRAALSGGVSCTSATACTAVGSYSLPFGASWSMVDVRH